MYYMHIYSYINLVCQQMQIQIGKMVIKLGKWGQ